MFIKKGNNMDLKEFKKDRDEILASGDLDKMKKLLDWLVSLFKVNYNEFLLDGESYDLSKEDIECLKKEIEKNLR